MLVLSRQRGQSIRIGDEIELMVVDVRGDKVRLGITAPRGVPVHRKEVYDLIREENLSASQLQPGALGGLSRPTLTTEPRMRIVPATEKDPFLQAAIDEARKGLSEGGLPIGSVLVRDGQVVAAGHNRRVQKGDPMAHAEIDCLTRAGRQKTYRDTILYSTLMPCYLCSGAVVQFGIPKVVVGESVNFGGAPQFMRQQGIDVVDLHDQECIQLMSDFIRAHPDLWNEDIGR